MSKIIQMYRPSQYSNWAEAERSGGVYGVEVPENIHDEVMDDLIKTASVCMTGDSDDWPVWRYKHDPRG